MTTEEAQLILLDCLHEHGWTDAEFNPTDDSISIEVPGEQGDLYRADKEKCRADNPYTVPELTSEQAETYYVDLIETTECVSGLGYEVPDIPSQELSVAGLVDSGDPQWSPFEYVDGPDLIDAQTECPYPEDKA